MKRKVLLVTLVALFALFTTASAFAGPRFSRGPWGGPRGEEPRWIPGCFGVTLTDEQKTKILEIEKTFASQITDLRTQLQTKILELRELQLQTASEENAKLIREKIEEILTLEQELSSRRRDMIRQILNVLTPEQLKNLPPAFGWRWDMGRAWF